MAVMRRPVIFAGAAIAVLVVLGPPFLRVNFGLSGAEALPKTAQSRAVSESLLHDFNGDSGNTFAIVVDGIGDPAARSGDVANLAASLGASRRVQGSTP